MRLAAQDAPANNAAPAPRSAGATAASYIAEGDKFVSIKEYGLALSRYTLAWLEMPDNPAIIDRIGDVYFATAKYPQATRFYVLAIRLNDGYEEPVVNLGYTYIRLHRYDQALLLLDNPVRREKFGKSAVYLHVLGITYSRAGTPERAVEVLQQAIAIAPKQSALYGDLGNAYYLTKQYTKAVDAYSMALELRPDDAIALLNRSVAYEKLEKFPEAIASLEQYLALTKPAADDPQRTRLEELKAKAAAPAASNEPPATAN
jgi:tetratricopeptide (TPR) repeat protein